MTYKLVFTFLILFSVCLVGDVLGRQPVPDDAAKPNIVIIMADDLGYGDVSCYGATEIQTPHIDQLAKRGLRFTQGYCSASTCTPTRYSMLTGNYAFRKPRTGIAPPNAPAIIQPGIPTIATSLRSAGYRTAVIGKWHLGLGPEKSPGKKGGPDWNGVLKPGPLEIGFDECFLLPTTNDRVPQVYVKDHRVLNLDPADPLWVGNKKPSADHPTGKTHRDSLKMDWSHGHNSTIHNGISRIGFYTGGNAARFRDEDLADRWIEESKAFIERNQDRPFFLFFSSHDLHVPRMPHERFQGKSKLGYRGDAILQLDWCVGELVATLKEKQLDQKTLIVFCSDNGPVMDDGYKDMALEKRGAHRAGGPFRGGKYTVYEGGTRTPLITYWPGKISPGESSEVVCTIDFAHSFSKLVGQPVAKQAFVDSEDLAAVFLGESGAKGRSELIQQDNGQSGAFGFRAGDWKLLRHDSKKTNNLVVEETLKRTAVPEYQLFDLKTDPYEANDVWSSQPEVGDRMKKRLAELIAAGRSRD